MTVKAVTKKIKKELYVCVHCPDVKSDKPGKCPKCGMELKKLSEIKKDENL